MFGFKDRNRDAHKKSADESTQLLVAPGTEISYKSSLINKYVDDHSKIKVLFNEALTAVQQADSKQLLKKLHDIQIALRKHLLDEELNLYIYLRHCYTGDKHHQELINKFKRRSKKVGTEVFGFISKISQPENTIEYDEAFLTELLAIGNMLETLLESEEKHLYTIYRSPFS